MVLKGCYNRFTLCNSNSYPIYNYIFVYIKLYLKKHIRILQKNIEYDDVHI